MTIDWDGVLTEAQAQARNEADAQMRAQERLAKAIVLAFAEAMLDSAKFFDLYETSVEMRHLFHEPENGDGLVCAGRDALLEWAKAEYGVDLEDLCWGLGEHFDRETFVARNRVEKLRREKEEA